MFTFAFMHYPYLVRILFGMPSLHLFKFLMFFLTLVVYSFHSNQDVNIMMVNLSVDSLKEEEEEKEAEEESEAQEEGVEEEGVEEGLEDGIETTCLIPLIGSRRY